MLIQRTILTAVLLVGALPAQAGEMLGYGARFTLSECRKGATGAPECLPTDAAVEPIPLELLPVPGGERASWEDAYVLEGDASHRSRTFRASIRAWRPKGMLGHWLETEVWVDGRRVARREQGVNLESDVELQTLSGKAVRVSRDVWIVPVLTFAGLAH